MVKIQKVDHPLTFTGVTLGGKCTYILQDLGTNICIEKKKIGIQHINSVQHC